MKTENQIKLISQELYEFAGEYYELTRKLRANQIRLSQYSKEILSANLVDANDALTKAINSFDKVAGNAIRMREVLEWVLENE
jgi:hypothetical protein